MIPVWIYVTCGEIVVFYSQMMAGQLQLFSMLDQDARNRQSQQTFVILQYLRQLYFATHLLYRRFSAMLLASCFSSFLTMLTSSYYLIESIKSKYVVVSCLDGFNVFDSFVRFFLICYTTDRIRKSVSNYFTRIPSVAFANFINFQLGRTLDSSSASLTRQVS